ncbi:hypothetical protein ABGB12_04870 [Actinocorallia sp. B10E7]|uniref:SCO6745 family protein n=1 Tax=Actinocorallia sp. B10E7 TaxID=3153558 RepID=UPI00325EFE7A
MSKAEMVKDRIQQIGGAFMFSREAKEYAASIGTGEFYGPYTRGRGGVLGDVDADVVTAAFGFFPPHTIRKAWESLSTPPAEAAAAYARVCQDFGRRKLAAFEEAGRLARLLEKAADHGDVRGLPLFAGWRAMPLPEDGPGQVLHLCHVLREYRAGLHFMAVKASGLTPLQAVLVAGSPAQDGPGQARFYGYPEPYEQITDEIKERWRQAESITGELVKPAFAALSEQEGDELVELLAAAHATVFSRQAST